MDAFVSKENGVPLDLGYFLFMFGDKDSTRTTPLNHWCTDCYTGVGSIVYADKYTCKTE